MVFTAKEAKKKYPDLNPKLDSKTLRDLSEEGLTIGQFKKRFNIKNERG